MREGDTFATLIKLMSKHKKHYYPILNDKNKFIGIVTFQIIQEIEFEQRMEQCSYKTLLWNNVLFYELVF